MSTAIPVLFDLDRHSAIVTGGNSGIGFGMARGLAAAGASVAIWGRDRERNSRAVEQIAAEGGSALPIHCDITDEGAVEAALRETLGELDKVDSCFVNAGAGASFTPFIEMGDQEWRRVLDVNLDGAFRTMRAVAAQMVAQGTGGSLVGTSSLSALQGQAGGQNYAASKAALLAIVRSIAVELARHSIRANAIVPGWIDTPLAHEALASEGFVTKVLPRVPARRWGAPEDFAGVAVFLASPASAYMTGQEVVIDGGYSVF